MGKQPLFTMATSYPNTLCLGIKNEQRKCGQTRLIQFFTWFHNFKTSEPKYAMNLCGMRILTCRRKSPTLVLKLPVWTTWTKDLCLFMSTHCGEFNNDQWKFIKLGTKARSNKRHGGKIDSPSLSLHNLQVLTLPALSFAQQQQICPHETLGPVLTGHDSQWHIQKMLTNAQFMGPNDQWEMVFISKNTAVV